MNDIPIVRCASESDVGMRRAGNQDSLFIRLSSDPDNCSRFGHLFVVADGMGGHSVGDLASRIAVDRLSEEFFRNSDEVMEDRLKRSMLSANSAVHDEGRRIPQHADMGTTCSVLSLSASGAMIAHIGDSRIYRVRDGKIDQLTFDHSLQWEMIRLRRATTANVDLYHPRNVITRCVGPDPDVRMDLEGPFPLAAGDYFVLCSDGLSNHLSDSEIGQIVVSMAPEDSARLLVDIANCRGGSDNITVIVVQIQDGSVPEVTHSHPSGSTSPSDPEDTPRPVQKSQAASRTLIKWIIVACCSVPGAVLLIRGHYSAFGVFAFVMLVTACCSYWFVVRRRQHRLLEDSGNQDEFTLSDDSFDSDLEDADILAASSPYRRTSCELSGQLLDQISQMEDSLIQSSRDSGWPVPSDELTVIRREAAIFHQNGQLTEALQRHGHAISTLMRLLYSRTRPVSV